MMRRRAWSALPLLGAAVLAAACGEAATASGSGQPRSVADAQAAATSRVFEGDRAWDHLAHIVNIGPRPAGSPALRQTRAYITRTLASFGVQVQEQRFTASTPVGPIEMVNLIARIPGRRTDRIMLTGHYDTKRMDVPFVGASDGGSSAAWLIEMARVLAVTAPREFTYEVVWLDGEEATCLGWSDCGTPTAPDNTYGSRHYVETARSANALSSLKAVILVDMIGDRDLELRRDANSTPWLVDLLWTAAERASYGHIFSNVSTAIEDDHIPFLKAGVPAVDLIDLDTYPYWHTAGDTLDKLAPASLKAVGDVVLEALPAIEQRLAAAQR